MSDDLETVQEARQQGNVIAESILVKLTTIEHSSQTVWAKLVAAETATASARQHEQFWYDQSLALLSRCQTQPAKCPEMTQTRVAVEQEHTRRVRQIEEECHSLRLRLGRVPDFQAASFRSLFVRNGQITTEVFHLFGTLDIGEVGRCIRMLHTLRQGEETVEHLLDTMPLHITLGLPGEDAPLAAPGRFFCLWEGEFEFPLSVHLVLPMVTYTSRDWEALAFQVGGSISSAEEAFCEEAMLTTITTMGEACPVHVPVFLSPPGQRDLREMSQFSFCFAAAMLIESAASEGGVLCA